MCQKLEVGSIVLNRRKIVAPVKLVFRQTVMFNHVQSYDEQLHGIVMIFTSWQG